MYMHTVTELYCLLWTYVITVLPSPMTGELPSVYYCLEASSARTLHRICQDTSVAQGETFWRYALCLYIISSGIHAHTHTHTNTHTPRGCGYRWGQPRPHSVAVRESTGQSQGLPHPGSHLQTDTGWAGLSPSPPPLSGLDSLPHLPSLSLSLSSVYQYHFSPPFFLISLSGVVKHIIPAVASTNAVIAGMKNCIRIHSCIQLHLSPSQLCVLQRHSS